VKTAPLPVGYRVVFDAATRPIGPDAWLGGSPCRILRLTKAGRAGWAELETGAVMTSRGGSVARAFTDAGLMHPVPPSDAMAATVTVVIPTRDRADLLNNCLAALGTSSPVIVVDDASDDPGRIVEVARRHGAMVLRRDVNGGPAVARNEAFARVTTDLVAFLDSDCEPTPDWLDRLVPHFADPLIAAVAPRVAPIASHSALGRYARAKSPLDLGREPGLVRAMTRVSYVPTAALIVRCSALRDVARDGQIFDRALRYGEDVDLIWRLNDAGWRVRYQPEVVVRHREPTKVSALLTRRFHYGTSAAPLSGRHPDSLAPAVLAPMAPVMMARAMHKQGLPARAAAAQSASLAGHLAYGLAQYAREFATPVLLGALLARGSRRRRVIAAALLFGPSLRDWVRNRPDIDPFTYALGDIVDQAAYGAGVIAGCVQRRTTVPLRPKFSIARKEDSS